MARGVAAGLAAQARARGQAGRDVDAGHDRQHDARRGRAAAADRVDLVGPARAASSNDHAGREPPGASMITRMREPARNTCANGNTSTRARHELAGRQRLHRGLR